MNIKEFEKLIKDVGERIREAIFSAKGTFRKVVEIKRKENNENKAFAPPIRKIRHKPIIKSQVMDKKPRVSRIRNQL